MAGKTHDMTFLLNAQTGGGFSAAFSKAQAEFTRLGGEIQALNRVQSDISSYQKQQAAIEATTKKLENLKQQQTLLRQQIQESKEAGESTAALEREELKLSQRIEDTERALDGQNQKLDATGAKLEKAGVDTNNLSAEEQRLAAETDKLKQAQSEAADKAQSFGEKSVNAVNALSEALAAAGIVAAMHEVTEAFMECANESMEFETAMAGVKRTVGGSDADIGALGEHFKNLSTEIPITTSELAKIAETAGQLGIARDDVAEFTEVMAMLGTTTDLTADTAATMLAQFANITGVTDYQRLGSAVADLGDATATTASKVVEMSQGMAAAAHQAGMSETDILGIAAAVGSLGIESQAGSTAMSTLIQTLYKAVETGDGLAEFAAVANMSAAEFKTAWGQDAVGAMDAFIQGLTDTERNGRSAIVILDELGITNVRQTKAILGLASAGDLLSGTIAQANAAWDENTALQSKADVMYSTTQSHLTMMQNAYSNLKIAIGDNYTPALERAYEAGANILTGMTQFVQEHPGVVQAVTAFVAVLGTALAAITAVNAAIKVFQVLNVAALFTGPVGAILAVAAGLAAVTAAAVGMNAAMKNSLDESWQLTAVSREQYNRLQDLNAQYDAYVAKGQESSYAAQQLKWQIDELNAAYENGAQSLADYTAAFDATMSSYSEMSQRHADNSRSVTTEADSVNALIGELQSLSSTSGGLAANQTAVATIIDHLNTSVPGLSVSYSDLASNAAGTVDEMLAVADAYAEQMRMQQMLQDYTEKVAARGGLENAKSQAEANAKIAQEEYAIAQAAYDAALSRYNLDSGMGAYFGTRSEAAALDEARSQLALYTGQVEEATAAYEENEAAIASMKDEFQAYQEVAENNRTEDIAAAMESVKEKATALAEAYTQAYEAAYESFSGQFELWEQVDTVAATSLSDLQSAIDSQISYWNNYNANLQTLQAYGLDTSGIWDHITDGSTDAAAAAQGLVDALNSGDTTSVDAYVQSYETLQGVVGETADTVATTSDEVKAAYDDLLETVRSAGDELNMAADFTSAAENTIQGYIQGLGDGSEVSSTLTKQGQEWIKALNTSLGVASPSTKTKESGQDTIKGYVNGVDDTAPEGVTAMQNAAQSFINAFNALMNSSTLYSAGQAAIQGAINGINAMTPSLVAAARSAGQQAAAAYKKAQDINSPSKVFEYFGEMDMAGAIGGVEKKQAEANRAFYKAGAGNVEAYQKAMVEQGAKDNSPADTMYITALAPPFAEIMRAYNLSLSGAPAQTAVADSGSQPGLGGKIEIHFHFDSPPSPELAERFEESAEEIAEMAADILEERQADAVRVSYR